MTVTKRVGQSWLSAMLLWTTGCGYVSPNSVDNTEQAAPELVQGLHPTNDNFSVSNDEVLKANKRTIKEVTVFTPSPPSLERELQTGKWLLLVHSLNCVQDAVSAKRLPRLASKLAGQCQVGVRPTIGYESMDS